MQEAYKRCEELLDLEVREEDPLLKQKDDIHTIIEKATPEQLVKVQEMLTQIGICNS